jgi:hypothetical protein
LGEKIVKKIYVVKGTDLDGSFELALGGVQVRAYGGHLQPQLRVLRLRLLPQLGPHKTKFIEKLVY